MSRTLSICHVLASHKEIGGLEKNVIDLATHQARRGHEVTVLTTSHYMSQFGSKVRTIDVQLERSRIDFRLKWRLKKEIQKISPDLVHAHANKPGHIIGKLSLRCKKVATVQNLKRDQSVFEPFDSVIAASQMVADSLTRKDAHVVWNSVAPANFGHKALALELRPPFLDRQKPIFFAAARFVEAKGFDLLLEAFAQTSDSFLWLVGAGKDQHLLEKIIREHNLEDRIWMPGFLKSEEVLGLMQLANCFVISSRNEGGPYTLAEALMAKCSVLSTVVGYAPEFLTQKQLVQNTTAEDIAGALNAFLDNPSLYQTQMTSIFAKAQTDLAVQQMVTNVESVYRNCL